MKQVIQHFRSGELSLLEVPCPRPAAGHVLVQTRASLISAGTERLLAQFASASLISKAMQKPEKVRQVFDKIKTDGLLETIDAVRAKLDEPFQLGYCNAGVVVEVAPGVTEYSVGDRIASNGHHAEMVSVPVNLSAKIPDGLSDDQATFGLFGTVPMNAVRLLGPQLGESVVVFGLGLVGLFAVQVLQSIGVRVLGIDLDPRRLELARQFGAKTVDVPAGENPIEAADAFSSGNGVDGVLIAATATDDDILNQSARMCRTRGKIVLVGAVNSTFDRSEFYAKEVSLQVASSYGPGRHDPKYTQSEIDYPQPFVRWTARRNIDAVLDLLSTGKIDVLPMITTRIPLAEADAAYRLLAEDPAQLGIVLQYDARESQLDRTVAVHSETPEKRKTESVQIGIIGAGNFTTRVLLPELVKTGASLSVIASAGGVSASHAAKKFGIQRATTDYQQILTDEDINTVFITTRHNQHAAMTAEALRAGKHVFVEKPLAIDVAGLDLVRDCYVHASGTRLLVGFNRRFSPHARRLRSLLATRSAPACMTMTVNAGKVPADHWIQDPKIGGGRIVGEGCHWFDLMSFLVDAPIVEVAGRSIIPTAGVTSLNDNVTITLSFADGSIGAIHYFANGHRRFPKERMEVFCQGKTVVLDNFRRMVGYGWAGFKRKNMWRMNKGHRDEIREFIDSLRAGGPPLITPESLFLTTRATLMAVEAIRTGKSLPVS